MGNRVEHPWVVESSSLNTILMAIKYVLVKKTNPQHDNKKEYFYAKAVPQGHVTDERLAKDVQSRSSLTAGDCKNAWANTFDVSIEYLKDGISVDIPHFGTLHVEVKSEPIASHDENATHKIRQVIPRFRPSKKLIDQLFTSALRLEGDKKRVIKDNIEKETRINQLMAYLEKHKTIRRLQYQSMVHIGKTTAIKDLNELVKANKIQRIGRNNFAHYILKEQSSTD